MFGSMTVSIMIVYPKGYDDVAIFLKHSISKFENLDSTAWTIEQYKQNAPTLSGKSHVIFLGDDNDNSFVKAYLDQMDEFRFKDGGCFGFDGTKAAIFGLDNIALRDLADSDSNRYIGLDGSIIDFKLFVERLDKKDNHSQKLEKEANRFSRFAYTAFAKTTELTTRAEEMINASSIRKERTRLGCEIFLLHGLQAWLKSDSGT